MSNFAGPVPDPPGTHTELYTNLDVHPGASQSTIDASWKVLRKRLHPDRPDGRGDKDAFQKALNAYEVLSNPRLREMYDKFGERGVESLKSEPEPTVPPVHVTVVVPITDLFSASTHSVKFRRVVALPGRPPTREPAVCDVTVPKGAPDSHRILVRDAGHSTPDGSGDLVVRVRHAVPENVHEWKSLTLKGFEAAVSVTVSLRLAILGGTVEVGAIADDGSPTTQRVAVAPRVLVAAPH
ncbi:MAG: J domain-containing protein, partial [Bacteroidota bacterium]|nr:J domain-containing protein [Bacteroidota bacterium]